MKLLHVVLSLCYLNDESRNYITFQLQDTWYDSSSIFMVTQIKEDEINEACSTHGMRNAYKIVVGKSRRR